MPYLMFEDNVTPHSLPDRVLYLLCLADLARLPSDRVFLAAQCVMAGLSYRDDLFAFEVLSVAEGFLFLRLAPDHGFRYLTVRFPIDSLTREVAAVMEVHLP